MIRAFLYNIYLKGSKNVKSEYILFTFSFLGLQPFVFLPFIQEGVSFVWKTDGISQHYPMLQYYAKILKGMFSGKGFAMVDYQIGMGFDTITTLHYYVLGDPISLLCVFMTEENAVVVYNLLIILRFYLAGISFIILMKYWRKKGLGVVLGALIYVFCGYSFFAGVRHPFFLNPMIYLPLLIIGLEKVLRRQKPFVLIVVVFVSILSNFYFAYMLTVISIIYVIIRYVYRYKKLYNNFFIGFLLTSFRTGGYYLFGIAMASFLFLPVVYAFMQNGRADCSPKLLVSLFHYDLYYNIEFFQSILAPGISPGYWVFLSFSSITTISVVIMFCNKKYRQLRMIFILAFFALFIPAFGYLMNEGTYITNRWCFLISLLVSVVFTITYDKLFQLKKQEKILLAIGVIGYGLLAFAIPSKLAVKYEFFILCATVILMFTFQRQWFQNRKIIQSICLFLLVLFTVGFHGYAFYSPQFNGYVKEFLDVEEVESLTEKEVMSLIPEIKDDSFYRIETSGDIIRNEALCVGFRDVSAYYSLMDGKVTNYLKQLEVLNQRCAYRFDNLDNRTILGALANVKYFVSNNKDRVPFGYKLWKEVDTGDNRYYLFQNTFALPLGYTYESYLTQEAYDKLSALEKQSAMMYGVVLSEKNDFIHELETGFKSGIQKLDVTIIPDGNIGLEKGKIRVKKSGASITLAFQSKANTETYVRLEDFKINKRAEAMTSIIVSDDKAAKDFSVRNIYHNSYFGKDDYLINAGFSEVPKTFINITFPKKGSYDIGSIDVYNLDLGFYKKQVEVLKQSTLQSISIKNNTIVGDITTGKKSMLLLSIPYSEGWSAYVDGKKQDLLRGNMMYMALSLEGGSHHIVLKYKTVLFHEGCMISLITSMIFLGMIVFDKNKIIRNTIKIEKLMNARI